MSVLQSSVKQLKVSSTELKVSSTVSKGVKYRFDGCNVTVTKI